MGHTQFLMGLSRYNGLQITVLPFAMMCQFIKQYSQISQKVHPFSVFVFQYSRCASQCTALVAAKRGKQEQEDVDCHTVIITIVIAPYQHQHHHHRHHNHHDYCHQYYDDLTNVITLSCQYCHSVSSSSLINTPYMYLSAILHFSIIIFLSRWLQHYYLCFSRERGQGPLLLSSPPAPAAPRG